MSKKKELDYSGLNLGVLAHQLATGKVWACEDRHMVAYIPAGQKCPKCGKAREKSK